jgi:AraC-like DNA-binding protein
MRGKFSRVLKGKSGVVAVKFTPGGFYPFARKPLSALAETTVSVREIFGAAGGRLEQAVLAATENASCIAIIEDFLRGQRPAADATATLITEIVYGVARDRGILSVDDLVARHQINKRTLQRLFAKYVGVSPKWVIQRYRLHEAAERLAADPSVAQSALATDLGYSDQAHFIRDFKALVGASPANYAKAVHGGRRDRV